MPRFVPLRVLEVVDETPDARSFVLDVPAEEREAFTYAAGQYCTFKVETGFGSQLRCYSMSSSPDLAEPMRTTVKRVPDGVVSNWLIDEVRPGDTLMATPPAGVFCLEDGDDRPLVAFAGGSGITPIASIVKTALATTDRHVRLLFANRDGESVILRDELDRFAAKFPDRLEVVHHLDDASGFLEPADIAGFLGRDLDVSVYLCGPEAFMDLVEKSLADLGHDGELVRTERFVTPLPPAVEPEGPGADRSDGHIDLTLAGHRTQLEHRAGETVLEAARRGGLQPPFSCQAGNCATCIAELVDGTVKMRTNDILTPDEIEQGWILTCQSVPTSESVTIVYPD